MTQWLFIMSNVESALACVWLSWPLCMLIYAVHNFFSGASKSTSSCLRLSGVYIVSRFVLIVAVGAAAVCGLQWATEVSLYYVSRSLYLGECVYLNCQWIEFPMTVLQRQPLKIHTTAIHPWTLRKFICNEQKLFAYVFVSVEKHTSCNALQRKKDSGGRRMYEQKKKHDSVHRNGKWETK